MKSFHYSTRKPGHDWHGHTRGIIEDLTFVARQDNARPDTRGIHFDDDGNRIPSPTDTLSAWDRADKFLDNCQEVRYSQDL
jgi:hypothetical protein